MSKNRIKISQLVQNQLPEYVRTEYPLIGEFLRSYYLSQEFQGAPENLIQNLTDYLKPENQTHLIDSTQLTADITLFDSTIPVESTLGFPDSYGLIQIENEIIVYESKNDTEFLNCYRGFSGITSYETPNAQDELIFTESISNDHVSDITVLNLSNLFLKEFFKKLKYQFLPGFENRSFYESLNSSLFLKQAKDFYQSKGTDESFKILFRALYGENVEVIKPKERMISPSNAQYTITNDFVIESLSGDPLLLTNQTLFQDEYQNISKAYAPITKVEGVFSDSQKPYYKLSVDSGYNRDITVEGAIYGNFTIHSKTKLIGAVNSENTVLSVDSTVGFPSSGELFVTYADGSSGVISYDSKTLNQFLNCTNITGTLSDGTDIAINTYAYAIVDDQEIRVRINAVLSDVKITSNSHYTQKNDTISIKTLGTEATDINSVSWLENLSVTYEVSRIQLIDLSNKLYQITLLDSHILRKNDPIYIIDSNSAYNTGSVLAILSDNTIQIRSNDILNVNTVYAIQGRLSKVNSSSYSYLSDFTTDVQNIYQNSTGNLIASSSLPFYGDQSLNSFDHKITFSGTFSNTNTFQITSGSVDHGFYTGDLIYYTPEKQNNSVISSLFVEGLYFIQRVDLNRVKFAKSASDIQNQNFVSITDSVSINSNTIQLYKFKNRNIRSQKLLRRFDSPMNDGNEYSTPIGFTGMLVNGTEILNYKSSDRVYYGKLNEISVTAEGENYDVISPPVMNISDSTGIGATAVCSVTGGLQEIRILNSGYDFKEPPILRITGGNGTDAKASAVLRSITNEITFNSESTSFVDLSNSTIGFSTYHRFQNAERIIYDSKSQQGIGGLTTTSSYYVSVKNDYTIDFHQNEAEALAGINTISLISYGKGVQSIRSFYSKTVLGSINIEDSGKNYTNQLKTTTSVGINTALNTVYIPNHEFNSGETVVYENNISSIGGLVSGNSYEILKIDENYFKLLENHRVIDFISSGSGTHSFNYPDIQIDIIGRYAFAPQIQPIFRGKIKSVHLIQNGSNYGTANVLNYEKQPLITVNSGSNAQLTPIVSNGRIIDVLVNNSGSNYNSPPDLKILGPGIGAILTPIILNGQIQSVEIIESGLGYTQESTKILVSAAGQGASFVAKIQRWSVNLFAKEFNNLRQDDGTLALGLNPDYEIEYSHLYAPRKLRDILYTRSKTGERIYNQTDLANDSSTTISQHSPIIGWAYDGNPIYGPYGYNKKSGGTVVQLKSGYVLSTQNGRPNFPVGFFVEDYVYTPVDDESVLDEHNGRFCVTPDFPNGTYAYFATFESGIDSLEGGSPFVGTKRPKFPFLIGNTFASAPNEFNFIPLSNQDEIDLNQTDWIRNTYAYNLLKKNSKYSYLSLPNELNQTAIITFTSPGSVNGVEIVSGGDNYQIGDQIVFENGEISAEVSKIQGKKVISASVAATSLYDVEFYGEKVRAIVSDPHSLQNEDIISISGLNTTTSTLEGFHKIQVASNSLSLGSSIADSSVTGIVTYFNLSSYSNFSTLKENDIYTIGTEQIKILNTDSISSRIRVHRQVNSTVGSAHSISESLIENSRKFSIENLNLKLEKSYKENQEFYFNPIDSLSLGTTGTGSTITFSNPGAGSTQVFAPARSIYLPNHNLVTGDSLVYSVNEGSPIQYSITGTGSFNLPDQSLIYVGKINHDFIGISTVPVGLGSTGSFVGITSTQRDQSLVYFTGIGTGENHSFKTQYQSIKGKVSKNQVTVSTAATHGLQNHDSVIMNVISGLSTTVFVKYDDYNRRLVLNPRNFATGDVNVSNNTIEIQNHSFDSGRKVIHTSDSPCGGLVTEQIYYVVIVDENTIKLSDSYESAISLLPNIIDITSASSGTLSSVNAPIQIYKNSTLIFNVSDSSLSYTYQSVKYSAFSLDFYIDENFTKKFESTSFTNVFEITRSGSLGISPNATVSLSVNDNVPEKLYYKLNPILNSLGMPIEKSEIVIDDEIPQHHQISIQSSSYNGNQIVSIASTTSFTYNLASSPEVFSYNSTNAILSYQTNSKTAYGPITDIQVINKLKNFTVLPGISSVITANGSGAILNAFSNTIGKIQKTRLNNIGFDFPSDSTLKPLASPPQIIQVERFSSFDRIDILSFGRGYTSAPSLVVIDGKTNEIVKDVDIRYNIGDSQVRIYNNTSGINDVTPRIIPIQNTNGVGISLVTYNSGSQTVTLTLSAEFSNLNDFPFEIGDKILVETIISDGLGYNSSNYNYTLFTVSARDPNIGGGNGTISYSLADVLSISQSPGNYDSVNSSGRVIPAKYFPVFNIKLKKNNFLVGEKVTSNSYEGYVLDWNEKTNYLTITSRNDFAANSIILGSTSFSKGLIRTIFLTQGYFDLAPYSRVESGWKTNIGFLNDDLQRIQDSDYYQAFSYSIKSRVDYETWRDVVGSLNHTAGFKKFADYEIESTSSVGIQTFISNCDVTNDLIGVVDLNCVYDFDLVSENYLSNGVSDEITFSSKILTSYYQSIGNRVLPIDDISSQFNHYSRTERYSEIARFSLSNIQAQKYFIYVRDRRFTSQSQFSIVSLIHNHSDGFLNQYGNLNSSYELGYYDFEVSDIYGSLRFYPQKYKINDFDVTTIAYNLKDNISGVGSTTLNHIVDINYSNTEIPVNSSGTIVGISSSMTSAKILVEISLDDEYYEFNELSMIHNKNNIQLLEYGSLTTNSTSGLGTYYAYYSNSKVNIDFIPNAGIGSTAIVNTIQVAIANTSVSGIGTVDIKHLRLEGRTTSIGASTAPIANVISSYSSDFNSAYYIVQVSDITNNIHQISELSVLNTGSEVYFTEFGNLDSTNSVIFTGIGTIGAIQSSGTQLVFTPNPNIAVRVNLFMNAIQNQDDLQTITEINDATIQTGYSVYYGTDKAVKTSFDLKYKGNPIFQKNFDGGDSNIVDLTNNTILIPNHYFVTGEELVYSHSGIGNTLSIGIGSTYFAGIGITNKLPSKVYAVKISDSLMSLASSAENALKSSPATINFTNVGIGTVHQLTAKNQNSKSLITIDNVIQSPITANDTPYRLSTNAYTTDDILYFTGITSFFSGDYVKIDDEIVRIESVGIGATNGILVLRSLMGTRLGFHTATTQIHKIYGNYNITDNTLNFADAPYGLAPQETTNPNEVDWSGISTTSSFGGRVFIRSGVNDTSSETYFTNHIFDDISGKFNATQNTFTLKEDENNLTGFYQNNGIILINDVFQSPGSNQNYILSEGISNTNIIFNGVSNPITYDVGISSFPKGGMIVSVSSTEGFGYQPLVSAGGTAIISGLGTVQSVSIGNSGSGYRSGLQIVNVGVATITTGTPKIEFIGTATVSNGNIVSVAITNPGVGYTSSNPPLVIFDDPLPYSNLPLIYSSPSSGSGASATIDVVVGQGSSVINFEIRNTGHGYKENEILSLAIGNTVGIPTYSNYKPFKITVERTVSDKFNGWTFGSLQPIDDISSLINGRRTTFPIRIDGDLVSIYSSRGSSINVQDNLLIFVNGVLQIPGSAYSFPGGSSITFSEPLRTSDDVKILFYKGTDPIDVAFKDVLETVKPGDELTINYDSFANQKSYLQEDPRTVSEILSLNTVQTLPYFGPGNTSNSSLLRPVVWCRQTEDKIINETEVNKTRGLYEASVIPVAYLTQSVGIGSTVIWVDSLRPLFNQTNESSSLDFQRKINLISQSDNNLAFEQSLVNTFEGDSGIIVGMGTTSVGVANTGIYFDLHIPLNSSLRDSSITGITTLSGIHTGYYFNVYNSNVGNGVISLNSNNSVIGIGSTFLDNVYQVMDVYSRSVSITGIGITTVARVIVKVSSYNGLNILNDQQYYGEFSWGKLILKYRKKSNQYFAYPVGISTGDIITRISPLKSSNYTS